MRTWTRSSLLISTPPAPAPGTCGASSCKLRFCGAAPSRRRWLPVVLDVVMIEAFGSGPRVVWVMINALLPRVGATTVCRIQLGGVTIALAEASCDVYIWLCCRQQRPLELFTELDLH